MQGVTLQILSRLERGSLCIVIPLEYSYNNIWSLNYILFLQTMYFIPRKSVFVICSKFVI